MVIEAYPVSRNNEFPYEDAMVLQSSVMIIISYVSFVQNLEFQRIIAIYENVKFFKLDQIP